MSRYGKHIYLYVNTLNNSGKRHNLPLSAPFARMGVSPKSTTTIKGERSVPPYPTICLLSPVESPEPALMAASLSKKDLKLVEP